mmetsp:Transcript_35954/g.113725  ORF Transcript_35954/g.113725 Transcript_35954/m.113725 type:complete len:490 (+) Transcript_35954:133-1602(+)
MAGAPSSHGAGTCAMVSSPSESRPLDDLCRRSALDRELNEGALRSASALAPEARDSATALIWDAASGDLAATADSWIEPRAWRAAAIFDSATCCCAEAATSAEALISVAATSRACSCAISASPTPAPALAAAREDASLTASWRAATCRSRSEAVDVAWVSAMRCTAACTGPIASEVCMCEASAISLERRRPLLRGMAEPSMGGVGARRPRAPAASGGTSWERRDAMACTSLTCSASAAAPCATIVRAMGLASSAWALSSDSTAMRICRASGAAWASSESRAAVSSVAPADATSCRARKVSEVAAAALRGFIALPPAVTADMLMRPMLPGAPPTLSLTADADGMESSVLSSSTDWLRSWVGRWLWIMGMMVCTPILFLYMTNPKAMKTARHPTVTTPIAQAGNELPEPSLGCGTTAMSRGGGEGGAERVALMSSSVGAHMPLEVSQPSAHALQEGPAYPALHAQSPVVLPHWPRPEHSMPPPPVGQSRKM